MLTHQIELYAEALNLGVTINTTEADNLTLCFWMQKENGKYRYLEEITKEDFQTEIAKPFYALCKEAITGIHFETSILLQKFTKQPYAVSDSDLEEFRDLIDTINTIQTLHEKKRLPWV